MRVFNFSKVIYDGYLSIDLMLFMIRIKPMRVFSFLALIPYLVKYLLRMISSTKLANQFYDVLLSNLTVSDLNLFKVSNVHKIDIDGFGIDKNDVIVTGEPGFLVDLFVNRQQYNVICTEYDLRNRQIVGELNMAKRKVVSLHKHRIHHIRELFVYSFKEKEILKMADYIFVYRDHEVIDYDNYEMTLKDMLTYYATSKRWVAFVFLAFAVMVVAVIAGEILTLFMPIIQAYLVSFFLWVCLTYYATVTYIKKQPFNFDNILGYLLGVAPTFLMATFVVLALGVLIGFNAGVVMLLAGIFSLPFIIFMLRFYHFEN